MWPVLRFTDTSLNAQKATPCFFNQDVLIRYHIQSLWVIEGGQDRLRMENNPLETYSPLFPCRDVNYTGELFELRRIPHQLINTKEKVTIIQYIDRDDG